MTTRFPAFMLCCRCSSAIAVEATQEARRWYQLSRPRQTTLDICPDCAKGVLAHLRTTPDPLEVDR